MGLGGPPDWHDLPILDLNSGNIVEVQAAPGVKVGRTPVGGKRRLVCVATDDQRSMDLLPFDDPFAHLSPVKRVLRVARYVADSRKLKLADEIPGQEPTGRVKPVALKVGLVPVRDKDLLSGPLVVEDQPLGGDEPVLFHSLLPSVRDLVVAQDKVQPVLPIKLVQLIKDLAVGLPDVAKAAILHQLVAITYLDISKALAIVISQSVEKHPLVPGKHVR